MLLAREFIAYVSRELITRLTPSSFETSNPAVAAELIAQVIEEDLSIEDRLNDEVRDLLEEYSDYMRRENVSYQEMFRTGKESAAGTAKGDSCFRTRRKRRNEAIARQDQRSFAQNCGGSA